MDNNHILLIEDDKDDQEIFVLALKGISRSIKYTIINDAEQALKSLHAKVVTPDYIFLDLKMPRMSGFEFLEELRRNNLHQSTPIIVLSADHYQHNIDLAKTLGSKHFIPKPGSVDELEELLRSALGVL